MVTLIKKIILIQVFLLVSIMGYSQTTINTGAVSGTWTSANSPYYVMGDIYINSNLQIDEGVSVYFYNGKSLTVNSGGDLTISGTAGNQVTLSAIHPESGWEGIDISNNTNTNTFEYCVIEYVIKKPAVISNNFASCGAIYMNSTNGTTFSYCTFQYNEIITGGGIAAVSSRITADECVFQYNDVDSFGGGIYIENGDVDDEITNCDFYDNNAGYGGGIYIIDDEYADLISYCSFDANEATYGGGGIWIENSIGVEIEYSDFNSNTSNTSIPAYSGGAIGIMTDNEYAQASDFSITHCQIMYNDATSSNGYYGFGGGIFIYQQSEEDISIEISNCEINNNDADFYGGGLYFEDCGGEIYISLNDINNNNSINGAGLYFDIDPSNDNINLVNNLIADNTASSNGGGIFSNSDYNLYSCTVANNSVSGYGGGLYGSGSPSVYAINTIIWGNTATTNPNVYPTTNGSDFEYTCCPSCSTGTGNIYSDPNLVSTTDYRIQMEDSYCDNSGNNSATYITTYDLANTNRILYTTIDIGAYESIGQYVCGDVGDNPGNTWTNHNTSGIDYVVICDIHIESGKTLNIDEGTAIVFDGSYQLDVEGCLNAVGTSGEMITFSTTTGKTWEGIRFENLNSASEPKSNIKYCEIENVYKPSGATCTCADSLTSRPDYSGAIYIHNSSNIEISDCDIHDNEVCAQGGGIYVGSCSDPDIHENEIYENIAGRSGGGICIMFSSNPDIYDCDIYSNTATSRYGGGIRIGQSSAPNIYENEINYNQAGKQGGGISICNNSDPDVFNNIIDNNDCTENGGGIAITLIQGYSPNPIIYNNLITNNTADDNGGGVYIIGCSPKIYNCTIADNEADDDGDGVYFDGFSSPDFLNDIIWDNGTVDVSNAGTPPDRDDSEFDYCDIGNFTTNGSAKDNIIGDPEFRDGYHISFVYSPCKDGGYYNINPQTTFDLDGNDRYQGDNTMDMGCYENPGDVPAWYYIVFNDIEETEKEGLSIICYPNPVEDKVNIVIQSDIATNAKVYLFDNIGKTVFTGKWDINEGENYYTMKRKQLSAGIYFLKITNNQNISEMHKLIFN